jgi:ribonuclease J
VQGILLTHGHEDHVGALPYLLPRLGKLPIYGTPLTLALIEQKLRERRLDAPLNPVKPGAPFQVGSITVEPIRVTHSIPDCVAYALRTAEGIVVFTGDFKIRPHACGRRAH